MGKTDRMSGSQVKVFIMQKYLDKKCAECGHKIFAGMKVVSVRKVGKQGGCQTLHYHVNCFNNRQFGGEHR